MSGIVKAAIPGNAFDVNTPISTSEALAFKNAGYSTCIRYIPRTPELMKGNLTGVEIAAILAADLSLCVVQHVPLPNWQAMAALGKEYGEYAVAYAEQIGLAKGINIWLDLEEVAAGSDANGYCRAWFAAVQAAGWIPGLYVGWQSGLTSQQLYELPVTHYWRAYNCDQDVPVRGYQIIQHTQQILNGITFDPNTIRADALGDLPLVLSAP